MIIANILIIIETSQNLRDFLYYKWANVECVECRAIIAHSFRKMREKAKLPKIQFSAAIMNVLTIVETSQNLRGFPYYQHANAK